MKTKIHLISKDSEKLNVLIPIHEDNGKKAVNARDLHAFLESKRDFSTWIKDRIKQYYFIENTDYQAFPHFVECQNGIGGTTRIDYALSISVAKELSMIETNEQGKQARKYFITCEEIAMEKQRVPQTYIEALKALVTSEEEKEALRIESESIKKEKQRIEEEAAPSVAFTSAVQSAKSSCLIGELAKLITQNGIPVGEKRLFAWMRENGYLGKRGEWYNIPNQQYVEHGFFELKKGVRSGTGGVLHTTITTKVTGKGQVYFVNKFLGSKSAV